MPTDGPICSNAREGSVGEGAADASGLQRGVPSELCHARASCHQRTPSREGVPHCSHSGASAGSQGAVEPWILHPEPTTTLNEVRVMQLMGHHLSGGGSEEHGWARWGRERASRCCTRISGLRCRGVPSAGESREELLRCRVWGGAYGV